MQDMYDELINLHHEPMTDSDFAICPTCGQKFYADSCPDHRCYADMREAHEN